MKKNLIWFRNDLRVYDNTALYQSCKFYEDQVIALFIATPNQWKNHFLSNKKISFIYHHLISLKKELFKLNIDFYYHESTDFLNSIEYLIFFSKKHKIDNIFYNFQYEINENNRDCLMKKKLSQQGISIKGFHDNLLVSHEKIQNSKNTTYQVFSFFKKKIVQNLKKNTPKCFPIPLKRNINKDFFLTCFSFENFDMTFNKNIFPIGEKNALNNLKKFFINKINNYSFNRNFPFLNSTSMLSPYLSAGIISIRTCLKLFLQIEKNKKTSDILSNSSWFNQILWREFYYHLLIGFPKISKHHSLLEWDKKINWINNVKHFNAWKEGITGFPIIDAGMRQLNQLGWMHNRLRMITSSFLVKNLLIDWRKGEKYFMSNLIDGDFALNNGGWQWSASVGCDSVPYIRFFNPLSQSKFFDKSGLFIKKFIPELKNIPDDYIHEPHKWSQLNNSKIDYPKPIIDYTNSKKKSLSIFNQARLQLKK